MPRRLDSIVTLNKFFCKRQSYTIEVLAINSQKSGYKLHISVIDTA